MDHISYSQYSGYVRCPRNWYLSKVRKAEEKQTWYIPIGSSVHEAIQRRLLGGTLNLTEIFYGHISEQMKIEPDTSKWLHGGSREEPVIEDAALKRVQDCFENAITFLDDVDVWEVEYDASGTLPGLEIPIKAYVDILGEHKKHGPVIIDWKTGAQKPKDNFQLETYAALMQEIGGPYKYDTGLWGMLAPKASKARPVDLTHVSPKDVGAKYQAVYERMQRKLYETKASYDCRFCFNQDNCVLNAGPTDRALYYDKSSNDGLPF